MATYGFQRGLILVPPAMLMVAHIGMCSVPEVDTKTFIQVGKGDSKQSAQ